MWRMANLFRLLATRFCLGIKKSKKSFEKIEVIFCAEVLVGLVLVVVLAHGRAHDQVGPLDIPTP